VRWPLKWFCTERFLQHYDEMRAAVDKGSPTAAYFYAAHLDHNDAQQEAFIRRNGTCSSQSTK
jgi:hypothetical protein